MNPKWDISILRSLMLTVWSTTWSSGNVAWHWLLITHKTSCEFVSLLRENWK